MFFNQYLIIMYLHYYLFIYFIHSSIDWLFDWLIDRLFDWLIDWSIDWLIDWLFDYLIDWSTDRLIDWLIDLFIYCPDHRKSQVTAVRNQQSSRKSSWPWYLVFPGGFFLSVVFLFHYEISFPKMMLFLLVFFWFHISTDSSRSSCFNTSLQCDVSRH